MKIIRNGRVYDMDYGAYEVVARIPATWNPNEVGNVCETRRELRRDNASGLFYVCTLTGGYSCSQYAVMPVTRDEAAKIAEDFLDYDSYVKFFGDPEGDVRRLERERDDALGRVKEAESGKDYWYAQYNERGKRIEELEKRVAELEAK